MNFVTRCALTILFAFSAVVLGDAAQAANDISKVNGSVKIEPGQQVGDVSTVNGSVTIGAGARAAEVETVNGSLKIEDKAVVGSAETVNGSITVGAEAEVQKGVDAVNGSLDLHEVMSLIVQRVGERVGAQRCSIVFVDQTAQALRASGAHRQLKYFGGEFRGSVHQ
mgnify:CR=1 FL=1